MGQPYRACMVTLAGTELELKFETYELRQLQKLTGKGLLEFVWSLQPRKGEALDDARLRMADPALVVPVIQAGISAHKGYKKLHPDDVEERICALIDKHAMQISESVPAVAAVLASDIFPKLTEACLPPGTDLETAISEMKKEQGPLAESPGERASSPGDS